MLGCWGQNLTKDIAIGHSKIKCSTLMFNKGVNDWFTIINENQESGKILLETIFEPEGSVEYEAAQKRMA